MLSRQESRLRRAAARRQKLRCHYCAAQMWLTDASRFLVRFDLSAEQAARFQCTAEHLVARRDGGPNAKSNVVAACRHCNLQRHDGEAPLPDAARYREYVAQRMAQRNWHPEWAWEKGIVR